MSDPIDSSQASGPTPDRSVPVTTDANALGMRVLYMIIFGIVFWILCWTLAVTAVLQLLLRLLNGKPSIELARFGAGLALFASQVIEYLTFRSERLPFPFSDWPNTAE
jgi:Domain of unknown function (DUF4389)